MYHFDEQIYIAILVFLSAGVGTKQPCPRYRFFR